MRIATYNLWNSAEDAALRREALRQELGRIDADIVALQEVPAAAWEESEQYPYTVFRRYPEDEDEGLAFLSKFPLLSVEGGWETGSPALHDCGLRVKVRINNSLAAVTTVHLDYRSVTVREAQILAVTDWIASRSEPDCLEVLCGDFNCYPESSVHRFLRGQQTLQGKDGPVWHDLAALHASRTGTVPPPTLDFATNPRWANEVSLAVPARFDWILIQDRWPLPMPSLDHVALFGRNPAPGSSIVPSDHYGVLADLEIS